MQLTKKSIFYVAVSEFDERHIPKRAGFLWHHVRCKPGCPACAADLGRVWYTSSKEKASRLVQWADDKTAGELQEAKQEQETAIKASRAADADFRVPVPEGLKYLPFQRAGIAYAVSRRNVLISDEPGLGKTIQALGVANFCRSESILVICPASLKINWFREASKWLLGDLSIGIADGKRWPDTSVVIVNYDILKRHYKRIRETVWALLIVDECHLLKNAKTTRAKQVFGYKDRKGLWDPHPITAERKMFLTGTPIVNRPVELWPIVSHLAPELFVDFWSYAKRYCAAHRGRFGWDFSGSSNLGELQNLLRRSIMVRRLKSEVLSELPPKVRQVIELPADGLTHVIRPEMDAWERKHGLLESLAAAVECARTSDDQDVFREAVSALRKAAQVVFEEMATFRKNSAMAKVPYVVEHLADLDGKVVVFAHHHAVIDAIAESLGKSAVRLDGRCSMFQRQEAVDRFQNDPECRAFVGSIQAAGIGLTLTASSHVVFAELDWVPGNMTQAEDRLHRIGQQDSVLVQHLVLEGSLDARMAKILVQKQQVIDSALDKK